MINFMWQKIKPFHREFDMFKGVCHSGRFEDPCLLLHIHTGTGFLRILGAFNTDEIETPPAHPRRNRLEGPAPSAMQNATSHVRAMWAQLLLHDVFRKPEL